MWLELKNEASAEFLHSSEWPAGGYFSGCKKTYICTETYGKKLPRFPNCVTSNMKSVARVPSHLIKLKIHFQIVVSIRDRKYNCPSYVHWLRVQSNQS